MMAFDIIFSSQSLSHILESKTDIIMFKGSRKRERRGVGKMPNVHNLYLTVAIRKAKSICNVLTNRQNAANCCLHRELKKSAEELRMGIPALCQYIDATMHPAPIGNGVQICSVYYIQILFRGFFLLFAAHRLMTQDDSVRQ
jgi:hypothetical protein